jgi:hypothetical protein
MFRARSTGCAPLPSLTLNDAGAVQEALFSQVATSFDHTSKTLTSDKPALERPIFGEQLPQYAPKPPPTILPKL